MKYSLLEMSQNILTALGSDEVNSISDTVESRQVAEIIRSTYFNILTRANLPEHQKPFSLTASGDDTEPVLMIRPDTVRRVDWIKYNKAEDGSDPDLFQYVTILPFQQFMDMIHQFNTDDSNVETFTLDNHSFYYKTDKHPDFCTVVKDLYFVFDSYDDSVDNTLQESKTLCEGQVIPVFSLSDSFIPDLDDQQFPLLLNEAKSTAFMEIKQIANDQAVRDSRRQWVSLQKTKSLDRKSDFNSLPNFGRR